MVLLLVLWPAINIDYIIAKILGTRQQHQIQNFQNTEMGVRSMIIKSDYKFATEIRPKVFRNYKSSIKGHTNLPYLKHAAKNRCSLHDYKLNMKDISRRDIPWLAYTPLNMLLSSKYHMLGWGRDTLSEYSNMCEDASGVEYIILNGKDAGTTVWIKY